MVDDITAIKTAASTLNLSIESTLSEFVSLLLKAKPVHDKIWQSILFEINNELDQLCSTKRKSILRSAVSELSSSFLESIIFEMEERCPRVLCMLVTLYTPVHLQLEDCFTTAALYAMAMHSRNPQMIAFQKMVGAVCVRYNCGNGLLNALGSLDISTPEKGKLPMLDEIAKQNGKGVTKALRDGKTIKVTVDNIDGRIFANQVRVGSGNRDYHYTHWTVLVDRALPIDLTNLNLQQKVIPLQGPDVNLFFCNNTEFTQLRSYYTWLIERILVEEMAALSAIKILKLLEGRYKDIVDRPSEVHPMFVIMKDSKSLPNCVMIMDKILETLREFYVDAGRGDEFENSVTIPLGGDQLTRVFYDSARQLRAGTHTRSERLDQFTPIVEEFFHLEQDLLEKLVKRFYSSDSSREVGTLSHYRALLHRTNVSGQVKSTNGFEAHQDFIITVVRALLVELACEKLGMENKDTPLQFPQNFKAWNQKKKKKWLDDLVNPIVSMVVPNYSHPNQSVVKLRVKLGNTVQEVSVPAQYSGASLNIDGRQVCINVPAACGMEPDTDYDVYNYSFGFLRAALPVLQLDSIIKAGDIDRLTIFLKMCIPLFIGLHSYRSKYAIECVNFLTKTECILSEYESVRVKLGAFVNLKGKEGENKAADMQQENNIKMVKNVIRGLGAGKTEKAMERASKAAPVVSEIAESLSVPTKRKHHVKKTLTEDVTMLTNRMRNLKPFSIVRNRTLPTFHGVSANVLQSVEKDKLCAFITRHSRRTISRVVFDGDDDGDGD